MTLRPSHLARRDFLRRSTGLAVAGVAGLAGSRRALAGDAGKRMLSLAHTHTGEHVSVIYAVGERYVADALATLNRFLRDHYSGTVGVIDPRLLDLLHRIKSELRANEPFQVISGYRSPATNEMLRVKGGGVASRSLHMDGKAIDIRLPGVPLAEMRDAALSLRAGGVGYYPRQFVHVDTGRVRSW
jgi:uncharacterized protein YcbK (DUF882 family)